MQIAKREAINTKIRKKVLCTYFVYKNTTRDFNCYIGLTAKDEKPAYKNPRRPVRKHRDVWSLLVKCSNALQYPKFVHQSLNQAHLQTHQRYLAKKKSVQKVRQLMN